MTEWYVTRAVCTSRWRCFTFWLDEGIPYDRLMLSLDGYELVNTHTLLADPERGLLVSHDFEYQAPDYAMLVRAETPMEAWEIYDERSAA